MLWKVGLRLTLSILANYISQAMTLELTDHHESVSCCRVLSQALGPKVLYASRGSGGEYNASLESYYSARESELHPACVVNARTTADTSTAVSILTHFNTQNQQHGRPTDCHFAIRGGGHTPWPGSANIKAGVTIDLSNINQVEASDDKKITSVGGGAKWVDVYKYLDSRNLAVAGGRVSAVGVGGLTLGGGISFFSPRLGFVCDQVESFELVGANGKIYDEVSRTNYPDLYRALKGGSNNFGIVTHFSLRTFPSDRIWGGTVSYETSTISHQFKAFEKLTGDPEYDPYAAVILSLAFYNGSTLSQNFFSYTKTPPQPSTPDFLKPLVNLDQLSNTLRVAPLHNLTNELSSPDTNGLRYLFATLSFQNSAVLMSEVYQLGEDLFKPLTESVPGLAFAISFQPLPQIITSKSNATGGNVLNIRPTDGNLVNVLVTAQWTRIEDDSKIQTIARKVIAEGNDRAKQMGVDSHILYLNYAAEWQNPIVGYGEENVKFLRGVSKQYDPQGVFQTAVPGGFKLGE